MPTSPSTAPAAAAAAAAELLPLSISDLLAQPTLCALIVLSVLTLGIGLERLVFVRAHLRRLRRGSASILAHLHDGQLGSARAVNSSLPTHAATELFAWLLRPTSPPWPELRRRQAQLLRRARRRLWILGSVGAIAPYVGLMGTVVGVMHAFHAIGLAGAGGFEVVSAGISEALVTTAVGIFVAVEAVLLFNYLKICVGDYASELRDACEQMGERHPGEAAHDGAA